jgi:hypothetical protein
MVGGKEKFLGGIRNGYMVELLNGWESKVRRPKLEEVLV